MLYTACAVKLMQTKYQFTFNYTHYDDSCNQTLHTALLNKVRVSRVVWSEEVGCLIQRQQGA